MVPHVCHVHVPRAIHRHTSGGIEQRVTTSPIRIARLPICSSEGTHLATTNLANHLVARICHVNNPRTIHRHTSGVEESSVSTNSIHIARLIICSRKGTHLAATRDLANHMVGHVCHIHIPKAIHRCTLGVIEPRINTSPICVAPLFRGPSKRAHFTASCDLSNHVVIHVCHVHIPRAIHRHALGTIEPRVTGGSIRIALLRRSSQRRPIVHTAADNRVQRAHPQRTTLDGRLASVGVRANQREGAAANLRQRGGSREYDGRFAGDVSASKHCARTWDVSKRAAALNAHQLRAILQ